jgi:hypothetical protein
MERSSTRVTERTIKKFLAKPDTVPGRLERSAPGGEASNNSHRQKVTDDNRAKEVFLREQLVENALYQSFFISSRRCIIVHKCRDSRCSFNFENK